MGSSSLAWQQTRTFYEFDWILVFESKREYLTNVVMSKKRISCQRRTVLVDIVRRETLRVGHGSGHPDNTAEGSLLRPNKLHLNTTWICRANSLSWYTLGCSFRSTACMIPNCRNEFWLGGLPFCWIAAGGLAARSGYTRLGILPNLPPEQAITTT